MDNMWGQGMGRNTEEEILKLAQEDLESLSTFLGTKKFFFGDEPHTIDCIVYAMLASILHIHLEGNPMVSLAKKFPNLVQHTDRFHALLQAKIQTKKDQ